MNINYGLLPAIECPSHDANGQRIKGKDKSFAKKRAASRRAIADVTGWLGAGAVSANSAHRGDPAGQVAAE